MIEDAPRTDRIVLWTAPAGTRVLRPGTTVYRLPLRLRGLGDSYETAAQYTQVGGAIATTAITATAGTSATAAAAGAGAASAAASTAAIAVPVIGAAVLAVTLVLLSISKRNKQKTFATKIVDEIEPQLRANRDGYLSGPRTRESQAQALQNFDTGWNLVLENCGREDLGSAGERCISERQAGGRWDWHAYYRDPIANDTPREQTVQTAVDSAFTELFPGATPEQLSQWKKYAAIAALAFGVMSL